LKRLQCTQHNSMEWPRRPWITAALLRRY
jgi:hypothetical protein